MKTLWRIVPLPVLLAAGAASAEEPKTLEPVVVTATKVETPAERLGAAVTVITAEEIRAFNYREVHEALRPVPGVDVQRAGGPGKATSLRIRGAGTGQVQVLVDGMRVKSPTLGTADFSEFSLDAIDRIEIVRGPQSTIYGADAIGGVVNIITKKGQGRPRGAVHVEGGSYETFRERADVQGAVGGFNWSLSGSRLDHGGQFDNDDAEQTALAGRVGYDFPWKGELALTGRYSRTEIDLPVHSALPAPTVFDPNSQQQTETWLVNLTYAQPVLRWWEVKGRVGHWWNEVGFQDDAPPAADTRTRSRIDTRRREVELVNAFHLASWTTLTLGAEHRHERGDNRGTFRESIATTSVFAQDELRFWDRVFLGGGLRLEDNDTFGSELTPRVSAAVVVEETGSKLRFTWGKGFRAPTINDLFFPGFGNPDLEPERSESYDIGVDQKAWRNRIRFGTTFFHNQFENLIQFAFDPGTGLFLPSNVGAAVTEGVETYLEVEPLDWLLLHANYTYTDTEDVRTGKELRRVPRHAYTAGVQLTPHPRLSLFAQAHVVSSQLESASGGERNPGYHRIDLGGTYRLLGRVGRMERLEFTGRIENVTDERYDEVFGFRALGVNALVGLRAAFE